MTMTVCLDWPEISRKVIIRFRKCKVRQMFVVTFSFLSETYSPEVPATGMILRMDGLGNKCL